MFGLEPGWLKPSIVMPAGFVNVGNVDVAWIVWIPLPGMSKSIVAAAPARFASWIAARSVQSPPDVAHTPSALASPPSPVESTTKATAFGTAAYRDAAVARRADASGAAT